MRFEIGDESFLLDGRAHRIRSGALHYFRVHPDLWADRIAKARAMGLNAVETYVAWSEHAPTPGAWTETGQLDLGRFLDLVAEAGMHAIVRPGPYICAEWDNGGLPAWLFTRPGIGIRSSEPAYLEAVDEYLRRVYRTVVPRQIDRGGPVLLVQIENEYGAYGSDTAYLEHLVDLTRAEGVTVPLITVDQPEPWMLDNGAVTGALRTGSFGSRSRERLATLRRHQPTGPLMCSEFWNGWFDHWGGPHHTTPAEEQAKDLDELLRTGASVNLYMFHGGTNHGFTSGANDKGVYEPTVTSYDYHAPLDEAGQPTAKYHAFREVLLRYLDPGEPEPPLPGAPAGPSPTPSVRWQAPVALLTRLDDVAPDLTPDPAVAALGEAPGFDQVGRFRGFLVLRATLPPGTLALQVDEVRDRAQVFVDGAPVGVLERTRHDRALDLPAGHDLVVLVEDQGRVNYGPRLGEHKGLVAARLVTAEGAVPTTWRVGHLDTETLAPLARDTPADAAEATPGTPTARRGVFTLERPADLFVDTTGLVKGFVLVNGFNLGRYWERGPQRTLYVPGPVTRAGDNEVVVVDLHGAGPAATFVPGPDLG